jgi:hypothetical protein
VLQGALYTHWCAGSEVAWAVIQHGDTLAAWKSERGAEALRDQRPGAVVARVAVWS